MVLVCPLDGLVKKVWSEEFVYICSWEVGCKWLIQTISVRSWAGWSASVTHEEVWDYPIANSKFIVIDCFTEGK